MRQAVVACVATVFFLVKSDVNAIGKSPEEVPAKVFAKIWEIRSQIRSGEVVYRTNYARCGSSPELEGVVRTTHVWFDVERAAYRIELSDVKNGVPGSTSKVSHSDGVYRLIHDDRPDMSVQEYTDDYENQNKRVDSQKPFIDPRLMGLFPGPNEMTRNFDIDSILSYGPNDPKAYAIENGDPDVPTRISITFPTSNMVRYEFNRHSVFPDKIVSVIGDGDRPEEEQTTEITNDQIVDVHGRKLVFPKSLRTYIKRNGSPYYEENIVVDLVDFNKPIDPSTYTWTALDPQLNTPLIINDSKSNLKRWDGDEFSISTADHLASQNGRALGDNGPRSNLTGWLLIANGVAIAIIAVCLLIRKKRGAQSERHSR